MEGTKWKLCGSFGILYSSLEQLFFVLVLTNCPPEVVLNTVWSSLGIKPKWAIQIINLLFDYNAVWMSNISTSTYREYSCSKKKGLWQFNPSLPLRYVHSDDWCAAPHPSGCSLWYLPVHGGHLSHGHPAIWTHYTHGHSCQAPPWPHLRHQGNALNNFVYTPSSLLSVVRWNNQIQQCSNCSQNSNCLLCFWVNCVST